MYANLKYQQVASLFGCGRNVRQVSSKFHNSFKGWQYNLNHMYKLIKDNGHYSQERNYMARCQSRTVFLSKYSVVPYNIHNSLSTSVVLYHEDEELKDMPETVRVTFIEKSGTKKEVMGKIGERAMYLAHRKGVDMEGACEASLACTTCHCYIDSSDEHWDLLPEATEKEEDLLDMAPFLDVNSRLGCQIILAQELNGIVLRLPRATKNFYVDGHKPQPH